MSWWKKAGRNISNTWKKAGKDISNTWKKAVKDVSEETMRTPKNIKKLSNKAAKIAKDYLQKKLVPPIVDQYFFFLESQAKGKKKRLPDNIISVLKPHYPGVKLSKVRYAEKINTIHGQGITAGLFQVSRGKILSIRLASFLSAVFNDSNS